MRHSIKKKNTCEVEREIEIIKNNKLVYIIIEARILYLSEVQQNFN